MSRLQKKAALGRPRSAFSIPVPWTVAVRLTDAALDGPARPAAVPGSSPPATTVVVVVVVMRAMTDPHIHRAGRGALTAAKAPMTASVAVSFVKVRMLSV